MRMSLENKVQKDFYYDVRAKITEFFSDAEVAAKKEQPDSESKIEILSLKMSKANIKLNDKANNVRSEEDQKPRGEAK